MTLSKQEVRFILQPKSDNTVFLKIVVEYDPHTGIGNMFNPSSEAEISKVTFRHVDMKDINMDKDAYKTSTAAMACFEKHKKHTTSHLDDYEIVKFERFGWKETARQGIL